MKLIARISQYANIGSSHRLGVSYGIRNHSIFNNSFPGNDDKRAVNAAESADEFERRIFSDSAGGNDENTSLFFRKLDRIGKANDRSGPSFNFRAGNRFGGLDDEDDIFSTLSDGMDEKLKKAAFFDIDEDEVNEDDYTYRPDINAQSGMILDTKVLDLTRPAAAPPMTREFETTTEEVLQKADFRNVRFLANFITEAGLIIKRKKTEISAKAQRKVAREIKIARAFGLMPFTSMGTKEFVYGKSMESLDPDLQFQSYSFVNDDENENPL